MNLNRTKLLESKHQSEYKFSLKKCTLVCTDLLSSNHKSPYDNANNVHTIHIYIYIYIYRCMLLGRILLIKTNDVISYQVISWVRPNIQQISCSLETKKYPYKFNVWFSCWYRLLSLSNTLKIIRRLSVLNYICQSSIEV